jgi:hypothetical protein
MYILSSSSIDFVILKIGFHIGDIAIDSVACTTQRKDGTNTACRDAFLEFESSKGKIDKLRMSLRQCFSLCFESVLKKN